MQVGDGDRDDRIIVVGMVASGLCSSTKQMVGKKRRFAVIREGVGEEGLEWRQEVVKGGICRS